VAHIVVGFIALIGNTVGGLFLQPAHHGKRLGKLMVDKAQDLYGDLVVDVLKKNLIGWKGYTQYGFKRIEEKIHTSKQGKPGFAFNFHPSGREASTQ